MTNMTNADSNVHFFSLIFPFKSRVCQQIRKFQKTGKLQLLYLHFQIKDSYKIQSVIMWAFNSINLWVTVLTLSALFTAGVRQNCKTDRPTERQTDSRMYRWTDWWTSPHLTGHVIDTTDYGATPLHHHKANLQWPASHKSNIHRTSRITYCTSINNHVCSDVLFFKNNLTTARWLKNAE